MGRRQDRGAGLKGPKPLPTVRIEGKAGNSCPPWKTAYVTSYQLKGTSKNNATDVKLKKLARFSRVMSGVERLG